MNNIIIVVLVFAFIGFSIFQNMNKRKELEKIDFSDIVLVDVRTVAEFQSGSLPEALNYPIGSLGNRLADFEKAVGSKDKKIGLFCRSGNRSAQARRLLEKEGYTNLIDIGAISNYPK